MTAQVVEPPGAGAEEPPSCVESGDHGPWFDGCCVACGVSRYGTYRESDVPPTVTILVGKRNGPKEEIEVPWPAALVRQRRRIADATAGVPLGSAARERFTRVRGLPDRGVD